jgi:hypothetical protein
MLEERVVEDVCTIVVELKERQERRDNVLRQWPLESDDEVA